MKRDAILNDLAAKIINKFLLFRATLCLVCIALYTEWTLTRSV